ncbi:MAG TPA: citryl-CoA lyase [Candidatus Sulfotelmatobacter sp.]|nr:citryl-CoA lyase [Candidatus Sulfotelmatobacter sp.]
MEPWRSALTSYDRDQILIRGRPIQELMGAGNFADAAFLLLSGRAPTPGESRLWNAILTACADHGPSSPSALAARVAASGNRQSVSAAVAAGVLAIGDVHGGAGQQAMEMLVDGLARAERQGASPEAVAERIAAEHAEAGRRIPGLGHRIHGTDPRTTVLFDLARAAGVSGRAVGLLQHLQAAASRRAGKGLPINIDGALGAVLLDLGFPPDVGHVAFLLGRVAGIAAHVLEERAREKPMRIRIPFTYDGPPPGS